MPRFASGKTGTLRRKPDSAPPPPPPEGSRRLSAADVSPSEDLTKRLSRASSEDMTMKSQSLPRTGPTHPREPVLGGTLGRQTQRPKGRQFRANTLSEGVPCEPEDPNSVSSKILGIFFLIDKYITFWRHIPIHTDIFLNSNDVAI